MNAKHTTALIACILILLLLDGCLTFLYVNSGDKAEMLHDRVLIAETKADQLQENYNKLLERVGGSDSFTPYIPMHPTGAK